MEFKTCEQYVLDRLIKAETDVESLEHIMEIKDKQIVDLIEEVDTLKAFIKRNFRLRVDDEGDAYVRADTLFEKFDSDLADFAFVSNILNCEKEEQ